MSESVIRRSKRLGELWIAGFDAEQAADPAAAIERVACLLALHRRDAEAAGLTVADVEQAVARGTEKAAGKQSPRERLHLSDASEDSAEHLQAVKYGLVDCPRHQRLLDAGAQ